MKKILLASIVIGLFSCDKIDKEQVHSTTDIIPHWNEITVAATKQAGYNTNLATRIIAIESIAVYDAVNAITHFGTSYHYDASWKGGASPQAAALQAAHDVLVYYFPAQQTSLDSALNADLSIIKDALVERGRTIGSAAAADIIALRQQDKATPNATYTSPLSVGIGQYRATPAAFGAGINFQWGSVTPFVLASASQFRPDAPPAINSTVYQNALEEVETAGSINSTTRTAEQTRIAQFYKQDAELVVNEAARILVRAQKLSIEEQALVFALVDIAEADARIALFEAKYHHLYWRPVTALNADADGSVTNNYIAWTPLLPTPAHPSYPSGHSGTLSAGVEVLRHFFGNQQTLTLHTTTAGEPARTVTSLSTIEEENGLSRIYGGIHFSFDNTVGQAVGRQIAQYVLANGPHKNSRP